jgi:hypothetical protein
MDIKDFIASITVANWIAIVALVTSIASFIISFVSRRETKRNVQFLRQKELVSILATLSLKRQSLRDAVFFSKVLISNCEMEEETRKLLAEVIKSLEQSWQRTSDPSKNTTKWRGSSDCLYADFQN